MAEKNDAPSSAELERQLAALREDFSSIATLLRDMVEDRAGQTADRARATAETLTQEAARSSGARYRRQCRQGQSGRLAGHRGGARLRARCAHAPLRWSG